MATSNPNDVGMAAASAIGGGALGAAATVIAALLKRPKRRPPKIDDAEASEQISQAFKTLVDSLHQEREEDRKDRQALRREVGKLSRNVARLSGHISCLEDTMRENGLSVPPRPALESDDDDVHPAA